MIENIPLDRLGGNPSNVYLIGLEKLNDIKNKHKLDHIWRKYNYIKGILHTIIQMKPCVVD